VTSSKLLNVIYDGQCGLCIRSLKLISATDFRRVMRFHDSHRVETLEHFPDLLGRNVAEAMFVVVEGEPVHRGFYAFRRLLWGNPPAWLLLPLFYFPGAGFVGTRIYAWVARNRTRLGCRTDFCSLPAPPRAGGIHGEGTWL
jgi:predicted DCC family thiol-disulfide oxidoreductase YuxK